MATVTMWAHDFEMRNVPPVCTMSGRTAECWARFAFRSQPREAAAPTMAAHLLAGGLIGAVLEDLVALRAKGQLPLTRRMRLVLRLARLTPALMLVAGLLLLATAESVWHSDTLAGLGFAVFVVALPIGALVNWRLEPHGSLRRINGTVILKLTNVHPAFAAAEEANLLYELEQGNWAPGFTGPGPVPVRFRDPLTDIVQAIVVGDFVGLGDLASIPNPDELEFWLEKFRVQLAPLAVNASQSAQAGKFVAKPNTWWVVIPLPSPAGGFSTASVEVTVREDGGRASFQVEGFDPGDDEQMGA